MSDKRSKIENELAIMPSRRTKEEQNRKKIAKIVSFSNFKIKMRNKNSEEVSYCIDYLKENLLFLFLFLFLSLL